MRLTHTPFVTKALLSGLVTEDQLAAVADQLRAELRVSDFSDRQLSEKLAASGLLTRYQAEQILAGRTKFRLGPYIVTDFIAQGGMGQVFKAVHELMGREVALKVLPLSKTTPDSIASFNHEIRAQAQLDHPHLVRAYDAGRDGNVYYMVTEFVPGADLRRIVRNEGKLDEHQAAAVISQAAMGLAHAHARGLIHRDVKPGNILVTPDGVAKVSDLGLAGFLGGEGDPRAGKLVGTPDYLSPEQIRNPRDLTPASDIYSLGCTLYYAVCGKVPFPGGTASNKARRILDETPWHPRRFSPELSEEFVEVIADMMEKKPADRLQTADEVIARLEYWSKDASPLPQQRMRARWNPPPVPSTRDEEDLHDTDADGRPFDSPQQDSASQSSLTGSTVTGAAQETTPIRLALRRVLPALPGGRALLKQGEAWTLIALTIAVTAPVAMLVGALMMFVLLSIFWR